MIHIKSKGMYIVKLFNNFTHIIKKNISKIDPIISKSLMKSSMFNMGQMSLLVFH